MSETPEKIEFVGAKIATVLGRNTFRRGDKYAGLRPGDLLVASIEGTYITLGVKTVTIGRLDILSQELGNDNHAVIDAQRANLIDGNAFAGPLFLREQLAEIYEDVEADEVFTVIEFEAGLFEEADEDDSVELATDEEISSGEEDEAENPVTIGDEDEEEDED